MNGEAEFCDGNFLACLQVDRLRARVGPEVYGWMDLVTPSTGRVA